MLAGESLEGCAGGEVALSAVRVGEIKLSRERGLDARAESKGSPLK